MEILVNTFAVLGVIETVVIVVLGILWFLAGPCEIDQE